MKMEKEQLIENQQNELPVQPLDEFLEKAYHRYAVLTILDRSLPDARDGLKPVQRRILYAMHDMRINSKGPHKKSARIVGEVMGKYHPHGDQSIYGTLVRMAQDFSMSEPLIDGQGNFGSIDGDSAAAMRYTEARLAHLGEAMLEDLEKDTVDWRPNFDDTLQEPVVLPTKFPNLLVNGSSGIAVGMSTSILPHNLGEVCDAVIYMANNWNKKSRIQVSDLLEFIQGPDLPTGGLLYRYRTDSKGEKQDVIKTAYETGKSTMVCQARADIKDIGSGKSEIIVNQLPYQVQKNTVLLRIAANKEKFAGLTDARDESDFTGMRVVFEVGRNADPAEVMDLLLTHTQMRSSLSHNALALVREKNEDGDTYHEPRYLTLKDFLDQFIQHRLEIITRRTKFDFAKADARLHIVDGLLKALSMIDEVVQIIRSSRTTDTARKNLIKQLSISKIQAQAILDMPLRRLASLERKKLIEEGKELRALIRELKDILKSKKKRLEIIISETEDVKNHYGTPRRTVIIQSEEGHNAQITVSDLVTPKESQFVIVTQDEIQRVAAKGYRDNVPPRKPTTRAVEILKRKLYAQPEDTAIFVSSKGRVWHGNIGRIPQSTSFSDFLLQDNEFIVGLSLASDGDYLMLVTTSGMVKRINISDVLNSRYESTWSPMIGLQDEYDEVLFGGVGTNEADIMICTGGSEETSPRVLRIRSSQINPQASPNAKGVIGIKMLDDILIGGSIVEPALWIASTAIILSENGFIKQVNLTEFASKGRGSQGVQAWRVTEKTGFVIDFLVCDGKSSVDIYSSKNKRIRLNSNDIPNASRTATGINLNNKFGSRGSLFGSDRIIGVAPKP